jgi:hypothetical protein
MVVVVPGELVNTRCQRGFEERDTRRQDAPSFDSSAR